MKLRKDHYRTKASLWHLACHVSEESGPRAKAIVFLSRPLNLCWCFPRACLPEWPFPVAAAVACSGELKRRPAQSGGASFERGQLLQGPHGGLSPQNGVL